MIMKVFSKKTTFPDYFTAFITRKSQCEYRESSNKLNFEFITNDNFTKLIEFSGNWGTHIEENDEVLWQRNTSQYHEMRRTKYCLPSDSTLRSDLWCLKHGDVVNSQLQKNRLEEIQRGDRKLRDKYKSN